MLVRDSNDTTAWFREQHHAVGRRDRRPGDTAPRLLPGVLPLDKKAEEERYVRTE